MRITLLGLGAGLLWGGIHGYLASRLFEFEDILRWSLVYGCLVRLAFQFQGRWQRQFVGVAVGWVLAMSLWFHGGLRGLDHNLWLGMAALGWGLGSVVVDGLSCWTPTFKKFEQTLSVSREPIERVALD